MNWPPPKSNSSALMIRLVPGCRCQTYRIRANQTRPVSRGDHGGDVAADLDRCQLAVTLVEVPGVPLVTKCNPAETFTLFNVRVKLVRLNPLVK